MTLAAQAQYQFRTEVNPDDTLTVYRTSTYLGVGCPTGDLAIPDTIDGRRVTSIGAWAFFRCAGLTSITIPGSVTVIGFGAFSDCTGLKSITIGNNVTIIGPATFQNCTGLTVATIPDSVTSIGGGAFNGSGLTSITIPNSVTSIGNGAFGGSGLTNVLIGTGVTSIVDSEFSACRSLASITIPDSVTSIQFQAFAGCTALTNVIIGTGVTSIGNYAFQGCTSLTSITIPDSVTTIGWEAFTSCTILTAAYLAGNAPSDVAANVFQRWDGKVSPTSIYYLPGTTGWTSAFAGRPTAPWVRPQPTILDFGDRFGPSPSGFGFVISWATNVPVVVEASADIGAGWTPISTNTLTDGWVQFTDPEWKSQPARSYRVRGQSEGEAGPPS